MLVFCDECGEKHIVDPAEIYGKTFSFKCKNCDELITVINPRILKAQKAVASNELIPMLELRFRNNIIEVNEIQTTATMGRQNSNDLVVSGNHISRSHARIEYRNGDFVLIDHSTNGTYAFVKDKGLVIRRGELYLYGSGFIGLGWKVSPGSKWAISFSIKK